MKRFGYFGDRKQLVERALLRTFLEAMDDSEKIQPAYSGRV